VNELTTRRTQAFNGATSIPYPVLDEDYVDHILQRLADAGAKNLPSRQVAIDAFRALGNRPEEMIRALRQLELHTSPGGTPDLMLPVIATTLRLAAADVELAKVEQMGALALAIFERIAGADGDAKGMFSAEAVKDYGTVIGREVTVDQVQPIVNDLMAANLVMRRGHGVYTIADPFVQETWREKKRLLD
jgi:hypothetical protein